MIRLDRSSSIPVFEQVYTQLRSLLMSGRLSVGDLLPSTRDLARQLDISFHTVRKAYGVLEREGFVEARAGHGFVVRQRHSLPKSDRMEQGAAIVQEALAHLVGLGLSDHEIDYIVQEQLEFFEPKPQLRKVIVVASYPEMATAAGRQVEDVIQERVQAVTPDALSRQLDADLAFVDLPLLRSARAALPRTEIAGIVIALDPAGLETIAGLMSHETLGLVVRYPQSIGSLMHDIKEATGFGGQMVATALDQPGTSLRDFVRESDVVAFLPDCRRRLRPLLEDRRQVALRPVISPLSMPVLRGFSRR